MADKFEYSDVLDHKYECFTGNYPEGYHIGLHWHYFMEILLMIEGEMEMQIGNSEITAKAGEVIVLLPSVMHSLKIVSENAKYYGIKFKPGNQHEQQPGREMKWTELSLFKMAVTDKNVRAHFPVSMVKKTDIKQMMNLAIKEMQVQDSGYISAVSAAVHIILTDIIRIWQKEGLTPEALDSTVMETISIEALPAYIDENISEELRVEDLARMCNLSYSGFSKKFIKMFGRPCKNYIELIRVRKVAQLLKDTKDDLNTISQETGFSDASHMIRCFKKEYGETPKKYRDKR
ncbi:MAG: helix-turn-helix transcriptional regulator [Lachnospiraceae bacterium]|nr:helix-turn-helix transcriptional regulator [Lachnospiraceae bacterium]